jgi:hypothetical protein
MNLDGPLDQLLESALPHEITHVLLAHRFGSSLPRWADEGAAMLGEAQSKRFLHEKALEQFLNAGRVIQLDRLFALTDFPEDTIAFYAESYSIVKFLVESYSRPVFLRFVHIGMRDGWEQAAKLMGFEGLKELQAVWLKSVKTSQSRPEVRDNSDNSQAASRPLPGQQQPDSSGQAASSRKLRLQKGVVAEDAGGIPHKCYTLSFQLVHPGINDNEEPRRFTCHHGAKVRLVQIDGAWFDRDVDESHATAVVEFKLTEPAPDKPHLEVMVQDINLKRHAKGNSLTVTTTLKCSQEMRVGEEVHRSLVENDNQPPKCWVKFTLDEGVVSEPTGK